MNTRKLMIALMVAIVGHAQAVDSDVPPQDDTAPLLNGSVMPPMPEDAPLPPEEPESSAIAIDVESKQSNTVRMTSDKQDELSEAPQKSDETSKTDKVLQKSGKETQETDEALQKSDETSKTDETQQKSNKAPKTDKETQQIDETHNDTATQSSDEDTISSKELSDEQANTNDKNIELELITRAIYQCLDSSGQTVFVDGEHRPQYKKCIQIRAAHYQQTEESVIEQQQEATPAGKNISPCAGALVYQGSTYIFSDIEPCPIPDSIFKKRKPIEASPEYYTPQP